jgi:carbonic anhydrase
MKWTALILVLALCACSGDTKEETHSEEAPHWSYEGDTGPEHWAELDHNWEVAAKGKSQSPIDLGEAVQGDVGNLDFHYGESSIRITNNGHTVQMTVEEGSWM